MEDLQKKLLEAYIKWADENNGKLNINYHVGHGDDGLRFRRELDIDYRLYGIHCSSHIENCPDFIDVHFFDCCDKDPNIERFKIFMKNKLKEKIKFS